MDNAVKLLEVQLNDANRYRRLQALKKLKDLENSGDLDKPVTGEDVNNHIHTSYSFSPYSPTKAVWMGYCAGLCTAGIMDHDSIAGAQEFIEAGKIIGIPTTIGVECRVDFSNTPLNGKRINNPDQKSNVYMAIHGIPHTKINEVEEFLKPYREERICRNRKMLKAINDIIKPWNLSLDFERDIIPITNYHEGGTITERHILFALSLLLIKTYGKGDALIEFLKEGLNISISSKLHGYLSDSENLFYTYDLLGLLKSDMVSQFYIDADRECPDVNLAVEFARSIGAISAYAYLGDIGDSVTGDKKSQKFEDDYLDELFAVLKDINFNAITYMPSRNTLPQLQRLKALCDKYGFFQISGEDINSPRQQFICKALENEEFKNLITSTWALIGHELAATQDIYKGIFAERSIYTYPELNNRIAVYAEMGKKSSK